MHRRILSLALIGFLSIIIINWSCTKLDTTNLGSDLIPAVDNVNTFDTTLIVNAVQNDFIDTTIVITTDNQALGNITYDPLFGKTTANIFFQLKPSPYPFAFGNKDSLAGLGLDSVVLCLSYKYFWGDSTLPQKLQVYEVMDRDFVDSVRPSLYKNWVSNTEPNVGATIAPAKDVDVRRLGDYIKYPHRTDSLNNQIRIKLDASYASRLFNSDSASTGPGNHAFNNDSLYRNAFNGFAVKAIGAGSANGLMYINLSDTNTRLEVHYRIRNAGKIDTTFTYFKLIQTGSDVVPQSATANYIIHDRSGTASANPLSSEIYLQAQPGTFASLKIPGLAGLNNRIIHRAELIIEQIPYDPITDTLFSPPNFLYLELKDTGTTLRYKPIYHDLNPNVFYDPDYKIGSYYPTGGPDYSYFGGYIRRKNGPLGGSIDYYNFNVSRYVQQLVTKQSTNYEMRLFPAYRFHYYQYDGGYIAYNNNVAYGRIRVGSGTNPNYPMRLRIIYSKIK